MKFLKIAVIVFLSLLVLAGVGIFLGINWVNNNLESVINSNPDRKYDIKFETIDFNYLRRVISIFEVKIGPVGAQEGVFVDGRVEQVALNKLNLWKLFINKELVIEELVFVEPLLIVYVPEENPDQQRTGEGLKNLFGDILSRGKIDNFRLGQASVQMMKNGSQIGILSNFNILATALETDSLKWNNPIPFDYGRIVISIDSMDHELANSQRFKAGKVKFDTQNQELTLAGLSLKFPEGVWKASSQFEVQVDLIEFELDSMVFSGLEASSNLYSNLDVRAKKLTLSGLRFEDFRDKTRPRPADESKPMFQGLMKKINFPLKLDTLRVRDGSIKYGESVPDSEEYWQFHLSDLNGQVVNITTIAGYQRDFGHLDANFTAKIGGAGSMTIAIKVPYHSDAFGLKVSLTDFPLTQVSEILRPIMNGKIESGRLEMLELDMKADSLTSTNHLRFDYTDLKMELFQKGNQRKNRLMSAVTNILLNQSNLPSEKRYQEAAYSTDRNQYRGPFHLIWKSTKDGMMQIVPGNLARELFVQNAK